MFEFGAIAALDLLLLAWSARRPWHGLVALLGLLPLNGLITQVLPVSAGLGSAARVAVGGWHDALLLGVVAAAAWSFLRHGERRLHAVEWLVLAMLALGVVYVVVSPVLMTAAYAYRVLYEPPLLLATITVLARRRPLPGWVPARAGLAFVATTTAGALFTWLQVYLLRFDYIQTYFTEPGGQIHFSYLARGLTQPRGIGFLSSPNELGAVLTIAIVLLIVPGLLPLRPSLRFALLAILTLALVLSFSRSGVLAAACGTIAVAWLARRRIPDPRSLWQRVRSAPPWAFLGSTAWATLLVLIISTSGATTLVSETISGTEPSAAGRVQSAIAGTIVLRDHPLGLGLGTAGPKAARFGEADGRPRILTEVWYLLYAIQVGIAGLALLVATALAILVRLWRTRDAPLSRLAIAVALGLGAGAVFIPIIEEPTVYTPLWALAGLALAAGGYGASSTAKNSTVSGSGEDGPGSSG